MQLKRRFVVGLLALMAGLAAGLLWWRASRAGSGWGVDAVLTRHVSTGERLGYQYRLSGSGVRVLRERGIGTIAGTSEKPGKWSDDVREQLGGFKQKGYQVVAFAHLPFTTKPRQAGNQLAEDLLIVFRQGQFMGREFAGLVDAWEMVGEPDIGFCTDLPDRVAAYQKALYLGLKAGARDAQGAEGGRQTSDVSHQQAPLVLMGALGMPPGPWLERAAANGLLDYTDAYNFHFYGHAADMTGVIEAHRAAIAKLLQLSGLLHPLPEGHPTQSAVGHSSAMPSSPRGSVSSQLSTTASPLPLWITEAGIEAVDKKDFLNAQRRQLQADFTISTAKQALAAEDVAVFMPFILVHDKDPYAMTLSPWKTFPAWDEYAKFTRENPWPKRALSRELKAVSPVVIQWLPDNRTTVPHKVSGTYRFKQGQAIRGELRIYNFSDKGAQGRIEADDGGRMADGRRRMTEVRFMQKETRREGLIEIPAMGMVSIPLEFAAAAPGYFRETWSAAFVAERQAKSEGLMADGGQRTTDGVVQTAGISRQISDVGRRTSVVSFGLEAWAKPEDFIEEPLPLRPLPNGVIRFPQIEPYLKGEQVGVWTTINGLRAEPAKNSGQTADVGRRTSDVGHQFWIEKENTDPLAPTMAVAAVNGLPSTGFIRLQLDKPMTKDRKVLVVLVDDRGQRYTIWENFGADYYGSRSDIWLNLEDFHADFWGPMSADYQFRPERVREVHLRFYLDEPNDPVWVQLDLLTPRSRL